MIVDDGGILLLFCDWKRKCNHLVGRMQLKGDYVHNIKEQAPFSYEICL